MPLQRAVSRKLGVCPQTVLWEFGSASPARTFVAPRLRGAASTLAVMQTTAPRETIIEELL